MMFQLILMVMLVLATTTPVHTGECILKRKPLYGRVNAVNAFADFEVVGVKPFPGIKVHKVSSFPDSSYQWQFVGALPDFTTVRSNGDLSVQVVNSFPGMKK